jgi:hypothetical protein
MLIPIVASIWTGQAAAQAPAAAGVTFTKDVAPILQRSCQNCHRPGSMAPMSLLSYEDVRPWARAIKQRVTAREMPPWFIDRTVGIKRFKNDPSLSDEEIATIATWVDGGAPRGNPADMPPPVQFADDEAWQIGTPDLIVELPVDHVVRAQQSDVWINYTSPTGLTEDRYIKAVETKPGRGAREVVHHAITHLLQPDETTPTADAFVEEESFLNEYAVGKPGDVFPDGAGRLMKAGSKIFFQLHYSAVGREIKDRTRVGFKLYPKGYVPKYVQHSSGMGSSRGGIDIPAGADNVRGDGYFLLKQPTRITSFQPHMHNRGKAMCMEAILPDMSIEPLSCAKFNFNWHLVYNYADDVTPLLPAGTIIHVTGWHDNSAANKTNPDPRNWVGSGSRTIDEMGFAWVNYYYLSDEDYKKALEERTARRANLSQQQP